MSATHKNLNTNHLGNTIDSKQSSEKEMSGFTATPKGVTNVVSMEKTRVSHNKLLTRKRKKSRHPLRELRLQRGFTLEELAELTRLSPSYLSRLESGSRRLNADILNRIAFVLSCHPGDLLPHDSHTSKFISPSAQQEEASSSLPQDLPLYSLDLSPEGKTTLNTACADAWISRPPEISGVARAFAFKVHPETQHIRYSTTDHIFTHPTRSLTPSCHMIALNANDEAFIGQFVGWKSDESGHPEALEMKVFEKTATGFEEKAIEIARSDLKASYRIVGSMEAA
tara:strand:- start:1977 stop:2825 length:849 start_codon:yes stop_codon:yes gene_type:complete